MTSRLLAFAVSLGLATAVIAQTAVRTPSVSTLTGPRTAGAKTVGGGGASRGMASALVAFTADMGRLPTTSEGLTVLIERPAGAKNWRGPYVTRGPGRIDDKPFLDPWGTQYRYTNTSRSPSAPSFEIRSAGPDMIFDNTDDLVING